MSKYCKKIIIMSAEAKKGGREATGIVKLERVGSRASGRAAFFNIEGQGLQFGIKFQNLPMQSFAVKSSPMEFSLHSASDFECPIVCIVAEEGQHGFLPLLTGSTEKKVFSESLLHSFVKNTTQNLDKKSPIYSIPPQAVLSLADRETHREAPPETESRQFKLLPEEMRRSFEAPPETPLQHDSASENTDGFDTSAIGSVASGVTESVAEKIACAAASQEQTKHAASASAESPASADDETQHGTVFAHNEPPVRPAAHAEPAALPIDDERLAEGNYYELYKAASAEAAAAMSDRAARAVFTTPAESAAAPAEIKKTPRNHRYYKEVSAELEQLFSSFPPEDTLCKNIEGSYFVRINYVGEKYYAVGLITNKNDEPQFICYAVPGQYSDEPPSELRGSCRWLPAVYSDFHGAGYWVMYQDTETGATVTDVFS